VLRFLFKITFSTSWSVYFVTVIDSVNFEFKMWDNTNMQKTLTFYNLQLIRTQWKKYPANIQQTESEETCEQQTVYCSFFWKNKKPSV